jgi:hypothetical protein
LPTIGRHDDQSGDCQTVEMFLVRRGAWFVEASIGKSSSQAKGMRAGEDVVAGKIESCGELIEKKISPLAARPCGACSPL